jgi:DNA-directed RNA polymerase
MNTFTLDTTEALQLEFWQLDNEFNVRREAQEKAREKQEDLIRTGNMGEAVAASSVISDAISGVVEGLTEYIEDTLSLPVRGGQPSKSKRACAVLEHFNTADLNNIAADSIAICLNGVGITPENTLVHSLGEHIEHEFMLRTYREQDKKAAKYLAERLKAQGGTTQQRYKAVEYSLSANRLEWEPWDKYQVILLGQIVFQQVVKHSGIFDLQPVFELS